MELGSAGPNVEPLEHSKPGTDITTGSPTEHPDPTNGADLDTRDLFRHLFKLRGPWMALQVRRCGCLYQSAFRRTASVLFVLTSSLTHPMHPV
jgi:hypothetical protein